MNRMFSNSTQNRNTRKFYVHSGSCNNVVQSRDAETAALWTVHQFLDDRVDLDSIDWLDESQWDHLDLVQALLQLGESVSVSEIGAGRSEAGWFDTADVMTQWQHLMVAIHRMDQGLGGESAW